MGERLLLYHASINYKSMLRIVCSLASQRCCYWPCWVWNSAFSYRGTIPLVMV